MVGKKKKSEDFTTSIAQRILEKVKIIRDSLPSIKRSNGEVPAPLPQKKSVKTTLTKKASKKTTPVKTKKAATKKKVAVKKIKSKREK